MTAVSTRRVIRISKTKLFFIIVTLAILFLLAFLAYQVLNRSYGTYSSAPTSAFPQVSRPPYEGGYPQNQTDITDTREFMKTSYSSMIKTRDVQKVVTDVKNIIKGADGRIDAMNSSEKSGYVTFVVAKSNFDSFREEVEAITHRKLYTENISSQNLLSTKQNIEEQERTVVAQLDSLKSQLSTLEKKHTQTLGQLNTELYKIQAELAAVKTAIANASPSTDQATMDGWKNQEIILTNKEATQRQRVLNENSVYAAQKQNLNSAIADQNARLTSVEKQDVRFANNIETVNGRVDVRWTSLWQMSKIFSPISPVWIIIILVLLLLGYLNHKKITPQIIIG
jgi:hypothetical protein